MEIILIGGIAAGKTYSVGPNVPHMLAPLDNDDSRPGFLNFLTEHYVRVFFRGTHFGIPEHHFRQKSRSEIEDWIFKTLLERYILEKDQ